MATKKATSTVSSYPKTVTVCGKTYEYCGLASFSLKPFKSNPKGRGHQHHYLFLNRDAFRAFVDVVAEGACAAADLLGGDHPHVDYIYKDLEKMDAQ